MACQPVRGYFMPKGEGFKYSVYIYIYIYTFIVHLCTFFVYKTDGCQKKKTHRYKDAHLITHILFGNIKNKYLFIAVQNRVLWKPQGSTKTVWCKF